MLAVIAAKEKSWKEFGGNLESDNRSTNKRFWQTIRRLKGKKAGVVGTVKFKNGTLLLDEPSALCRWNDYFCEIISSVEATKDDRTEVSDFFKWDLMSAFSGGDDDDEEEALQREEEDANLQNSCDCKGMKCDCCVDFNVSSIIDFGGPGCVNMKYISKEEGVLLNVSYGENVLHSQTVTNKNKKGTCMSLLSYFAEICARFENLKESGDGMVGCLNFEPTVFGEVTSQYPVGCFRMGPDGMFVDNSVVNVTEINNEGKENEVTSEKPEEEDEEDNQSFMEAVNQSAQESLEFFSSLLGFNIGGKKSTKNSTQETDTSNKGETSRQIENDHLGLSQNLI